MNRIEVDPWQKKNVNALQAYRVEGSLFTIPFVISSDLTLIKPKEMYVEGCRCLPSDFCPSFDEKGAPVVTKPICLSDPIEIKADLKIYLKESSSQHMSTILEGIEDSSIKFAKVDYLVTSETLNKIAGSVYNQERSWKLRAYLEDCDGKKMIVLCDDDLEEEAPPSQATEFYQERLDSANFAQDLCERGQTKTPNPYLHGCLAVQSNISTESQTVKMVVFGEVDMLIDHQPAISFVRTGIGRSNRVNLTYEEEGMSRCPEYLWSRAFWLGLGTCVFGLRQNDQSQVEVIQRYSLPEFYRQHRHRNNKEADVATSCVARVLVRLREAVHSNPRANWIIEYEGRDLDLDPDNIKIYEAENSFCFRLIREKFHLVKTSVMCSKRDKKEPTQIIRRFPQKSYMKFAQKTEKKTVEQIRKYISIP